MKKKGFILLIFTFITWAFFGSDKDLPFDLAELKLPPCNVGSITTTKVHFFIDIELKKIINEKFASDQIKQSNLVLSNSCLSLRRKLVSFEYIDMGLSGRESFDQIYKENIKSIGSIGQVIRTNPLHYYVFIIPSSHLIFENWVEGITYWKKDSSFILLNESATPYMLEHEFGHLMWANHSETKLFPLLQGKLERTLDRKDRYLVKKYARAYKCSNAGTVMSYEKIKLPIYSSPEIYYRSQRCGDLTKANNKKQVSEHIKTLINKIQKGDINAI